MNVFYCAIVAQVPVQFEFINKLSDNHYCKPWLTIEPPRGFIHVSKYSLLYAVADHRDFSMLLNQMSVKWLSVFYYYLTKYYMSDLSTNIQHCCCLKILTLCDFFKLSCTKVYLFIIGNLCFKFLSVCKVYYVLLVYLQMTRRLFNLKSMSTNELLRC